MKTILTLISSFIFINMLSARHIQAVSSGDWSSPSTWNLNQTPAPNDTVTIPENVKVSISATYTYSGSPIDIEIFGELNFHNSGAKLNLVNNSGVTLFLGGLITGTGTGEGSSQSLKIGTVTYWSRSMGTQEGPQIFGSGTPLPVDVVNIGYEVNTTMVLIHWQTTNEQNNAYFRMERSADGKVFNLLEKIYPSQSPEPVKQYHFYDKDVQGGLSYYRLVQVDKNGDFNILKTFPIKLPINIETNIYPTMSDKSINVSIDSNKRTRLNMTLVNASGTVIKELSYNIKEENNFYSIDISQIPSGSYFLRINSIDGSINIVKSFVRE